MSDYTSIHGPIRAAVLQKGDGTTGYTNTLRLGPDTSCDRKTDATCGGLTKDGLDEFWISNKTDTASRRLAQTGTLIALRTTTTPAASNAGHGVIVLDSSYGSANYTLDGTTGTNPLELASVDIKDGEIAHIVWQVSLSGTPSSDVEMIISADSGSTIIAQETMPALAGSVYSIESIYANVTGSTDTVTLAFTPTTISTRERVIVSRLGYEDANPIT